MEYKMRLTKKYLGIPIKTASEKEQNLKRLEIFTEGHKIMEFQIPVTEQGEEYSYDYLGFIPVDAYQEREVCLTGELPSAFFQAVKECDTAKQETVERPLAHFTAERGWINDPNGLVCDNGIYHLYFQYNPFNTEWQNMSWGHAVSTDMVHWQQRDMVMWPDENGTIFSGCGIQNIRGCFGLPKEALLFFYTAAACEGYQWSEGKQFTQRMAYSLDGGRTLVKYPDWELKTIEAENRDPKIFWHEENDSYVMTLWLQGNEFAILRSVNLQDWELTQRFTLDKAWECPDLFRLRADDGEEKWVFWSADGFYYIGTFDGCAFELEEDRKEAYQTRLPYAAQTYSGVKDRVISVAWLRTRHEEQLYTGAMALPRELSLRRTEQGYRIVLTPVREFYKALEKEKQEEKTTALHWEGGVEKPVYMTSVFRGEQGKETRISLSGNEIYLSADRKTLSFMGNEYPFTEKLDSLSLFADKGILEITANNDIIYLTFETCNYRLTGEVDYDGESADITVSTVKNI